jgi:hypothetical protein
LADQNLSIAHDERGRYKAESGRRWAVAGTSLDFIHASSVNL